MKACVYVTVLAGVLLCCRAETVKERVTAAFAGLSQKCKDGIQRNSGPCEESKTFGLKNLTTKRREVCDHKRVMRGHQSCMLQAGCSQNETDAFRVKLCDFTFHETIRGSKGLFLKFSAACKPHFDVCKDKEETKQLINEENFCLAFKECSKLDDCFNKKKDCKGEEDQENFKNIRDKACSGVARLAYGGAGLVLAVVLSLLYRL